MALRNETQGINFFKSKKISLTLKIETNFDATFLIFKIKSALFLRIFFNLFVIIVRPVWLNGWVFIYVGSSPVEVT